MSLATNFRFSFHFELLQVIVGFHMQISQSIKESVVFQDSYKHKYFEDLPFGDCFELS